MENIILIFLVCLSFGALTLSLLHCMWEGRDESYFNLKTALKRLQNDDFGGVEIFATFVFGFLIGLIAVGMINKILIGT